MAMSRRAPDGRVHPSVDDCLQLAGRPMARGAPSRVGLGRPGADSLWRRGEGRHAHDFPDFFLGGGACFFAGGGAGRQNDVGVTPTCLWMGAPAPPGVFGGQ